MTDTERYELIRPILREEKRVSDVSQATGVSQRTLYRYLARFREEGVEGLSDKSHAALSHPKWFTEEQKDLVVHCKWHHPQMSARQLARQLTETGLLTISDHSVTNILHERKMPLRFSPSSAADARSHVGEFHRSA